MGAGQVFHGDILLKYLDQLFMALLVVFATAVADLHSKIWTRPPGGPNSFNFMQFLRNFGKIVCWPPPPPLGSWRPHLGEILDPPLNRAHFCEIISRKSSNSMGSGGGGVEVFCYTDTIRSRNEN